PPRPTLFPYTTLFRSYAEKVRQQLAQLPSLRDLQYEQSLEYPTIEVNVDRALAGLSGVTAEEVGRALAPATLSSRFTTPLYWREDRKSTRLNSSHVAI